MVVLLILVGIGFLLSLYALWAEYRFRKTGSAPLCDLSESVSCTRAFTSSYGRIAGLPNALYGVGFYLAAFALAWLQQYPALFVLALISVAGSAYLAYISYAKLKTYCLVCTGVYLVNVLLLAFAYASL